MQFRSLSQSKNSGWSTGSCVLFQLSTKHINKDNPWIENASRGNRHTKLMWFDYLRYSIWSCGILKWATNERISCNPANIAYFFSKKFIKNTDKCRRQIYWKRKFQVNLSYLSLEWAFAEKELERSNLRMSLCNEIRICHGDLIVISE